jgi:hypothetical protein
MSAAGVAVAELRQEGAAPFARLSDHTTKIKNQPKLFLHRTKCVLNIALTYLWG